MARSFDIGGRRSAKSSIIARFPARIQALKPRTAAGRLEEATFRERGKPTSGDDKMVERPNVDQRQRLLERLREKLVRARRFRDARWMIVGKDHRGRVASERCLDDFARIDAGLRERPAEKLLGSEHAILAVEEQSHEHFVRTSTKRKSQIIADRLGRDERIALGSLLCQ